MLFDYDRALFEVGKRVEACFMIVVPLSEQPPPAPSFKVGDHVRVVRVVPTGAPQRKHGVSHGLVMALEDQRAKVIVENQTHREVWCVPRLAR